MTPRKQALLPCPFCGSPVTHVESLAKSFDPPRLWHEWHHELINDCWLFKARGHVLGGATDDVKMQAKFCEQWNRRADHAAPQEFKLFDNLLNPKPASVSPQAPTAKPVTAPLSEGVGQGGTAAGADWQWVPRALCERIAVLFASFHGVGMENKDANGNPTPNAMLCYEIAEQLGSLLSTAPRSDAGEGEK